MIKTDPITLQSLVEHSGSNVVATSIQQLAETPVAGDGQTDYSFTADATVLEAGLTASKFAVPHHLTVDVRLDSILARIKYLHEKVQVQVTPDGFLIKAAASAMKKFPAVNASRMGTSVNDDVHINVAVRQGDRLVAPLIRDVHLAGVKSISDSVQSHKSVLEDSTLSPVNYAAGTFTIVNLGLGIKSVTAIVQEPQVCVLAIGAAEERVVPGNPTEEDDAIKESLMLRWAHSGLRHSRVWRRSLR